MPLARSGNRFVAHADMLGMSDVALRDPHLAFAVLSRLSDAKDEILNMGIEVISSGLVIRDQIEQIIFSDTVVIVTKSDSEADVYAVTLLCAEFFYRALSYNVPIRAGVAHGVFLDDPNRNLFVGPPLVNAYRLGESAAWLGIVVDSVTASRARAIPLQSDRGKSIIVDYDVPLSSGGKVVRPVVDWVEPHRTHFRMSLPTSGREFYTFDQLFGPFDQLPKKIQVKYENTAEFINVPRP